ncbi:MAG: hypothetical protein M3Z23_08485 [Acidobacteriota bacterium]|nr:hypothetical protein [Acidobacteriota bacterium]
MIENFLKFRGGFGVLARGQICLAAHIDGIEAPERCMWNDTRGAELVRSGDLQQLDCLRRLRMVQRETRANGRHVAEPDSGVVIEAPFQVIGNCLSP